MDCRWVPLWIPVPGTLPSRRSASPALFLCSYGSLVSPLLLLSLGCLSLLT